MDQDKRIQRYPEFSTMHTRRDQRASSFAYYAGYTVHFQSIDWEDLREGNVCLGLRSPGWTALRPRGEESAKAPEITYCIFVQHP